MHPFISNLATLSFPNCFNPYSDRCEVHDHPDAPSIRKETLSRFLDQALKRPVHSIWIGRDLGYRGGRRTGLPLTDDAHLQTHADRWDCDVVKPTVGETVRERTATIIWNELHHIEECIFLWNVFPLHPHEERNVFTNRQHNSKERNIGLTLLNDLVSLLQPQQLVAIGGDAERAARKVGGQLPITRVRHPSYGGQKQFQEQIRQLYTFKT